MKKLVTIFCGMAIAMSAMAYVPMLVDGYQWNEIRACYNPNDPYLKEEVYKTYKRMVKGDSIVNGVTYKKIISTADEKGQKWNFMCLLREDVEKQRVYRLDDKTGESWLLYDFSVSEGDTIKDILPPFPNEISHFVVKKVDTFTDKLDRELKRFTGVIGVISSTYDTIYDYREYVIMERYGCETGFTKYNEAGIFGGIRGGSLLCAYDENEKLTWEASYLGESDIVDSCFVWKTIPVGTPVVSESGISVIVNSQTRELSIITDTHTSATIYDMQGRALRTVALEAPTTIVSVSSMPAGIYVVVLANDAGNREYGKIVVP